MAIACVLLLSILVIFCYMCKKNGDESDEGSSENTLQSRTDFNDRRGSFIEVDDED